ncbi:MAG: ABC transporter ATP-binding protein [Promethearchaeota archaeon]
MKPNYRNLFLKKRRKFLESKYKTSFRQILSYLWDYKWIFISDLIVGLFQSLLFLTFPLYLGLSLDILMDPAIPIDNMFPVFINIILIQSIVGILYGFRIYVNRWIGANIIFNLRDDLFMTLQLMSFKWFDKHKTGDLISRTTSDVNLLKEFFGNNLQSFVREAATLGFSFLILSIINLELSLFILIVSPVLFYSLIIFRKKMRSLFKKSRELYSDLTRTIQENWQGITVVKSFAREPYEMKKFKKENKAYRKDSMGMIKLQSIFDPIIYLIDNIAFLIVILLGSIFVLNGNLTFGDLFAFVIVLNFTIDPLYFISRFLGNMPQITETCERITQILNSKIDVKEKEDAIELPSIKGNIEFKNVYFSYNDDGNHYVLKNINLKVKPGENIAILGATGSGKSSLVKLIPRFHEISKGQILIDDIDIGDVTFKSLRSQIGYVSQECFLFYRSIRENIGFGNRKIDLEDIKKVAMVSDIHNFIEEELPQKYETRISEGGTTLSGGQKQRITIARALAIKPKILILDDATSSVDVDTEYRIQKHFKKIFKDSTTFLITQRLSSVRNADRIIVLKDGEISQIGSHEELMDQDEGIYKKLYLSLKIEEKAQWV